MDNSISVVIPTYKRNGFIRAAIDSVICNIGDFSEVLVIDDNDEEALSLELKLIISSYENPNIKCYKNFRKKGGAGARNSGIMLASKKYIAFLDDDDRWLPNKIAEQLKVLTNEKCGLVFCSYYVNDLIYSTRNFIQLNDEFVTFEALALCKCPASTSLAVGEKKLFIDAGMFDEGLLGLQDYDLWLRCALIARIKTTTHPGAEIYIHPWDRISVDINKRLKSISYFQEKWNATDIVCKNHKIIKNKILAEAMVAISKRCQYEGLYWLSVFWAIQAILKRPANYLYWRWFVLAILGFKLTKIIKKNGQL